MRILIADDAAPVRSAIRRLLKEENNVQVVGEAANLGELIHLARATQPNLILLDWELSGMPGSTKRHPEAPPLLDKGDKRRNVILAELRLFESQPWIIVLSSYPEAERISLSAGADGFIFKGNPPDRLVSAIRSLATEG